MSEKMTAFFVERTGHVLGAVTRAAGNGQASRMGPIQEDVLVEISGLSGSGSGATVTPMQFLVPGKELSTLVVNPLPAVLLQPLAFHAPKETDAQGVVQRPKEVKQLPGRTLSFISVTATQITVSLPTPGATKTESTWIMVAGKALAAPLIITGDIAKSASTASFAIPQLAPGVYQVLVLVEEWLPFAGGTAL
jgi:hypothetical protein